MKLALVSDSHDNMDAIRRAVAALDGKGIDLLLHAGDYVAPFAVKEWLNLGVPMAGVFGNNDGERGGIVKACAGIVRPPLFVEREGKRIAVVHDLSRHDVEEWGSVDVIVHGHTHRCGIDRRGETLMINPGESCGWLTGRSTAVVLDLASGDAEVIEF